MHSMRDIRRVLLVLRKGAAACGITERERRPPRKRRGAVKQPYPAGIAAPKSWAAEAERLHVESQPWLRQKGVQGYGLGKKVKDGTSLDQYCLKVLVQKKLPKSQCRLLVPETLRVEGIEEPVPTDVEAIGRVRFQMNTGRVRPARPGFSISPEKTQIREAGTFGCLVRKTDGGGLFILSAAHVLAIPDVGPVGGKIVQPGTLDQWPTGPDNEIAELYQWSAYNYEPSTEGNTIDAAIAQVLHPSDVNPTIQDLGLPRGISNQVQVGDRVRISGRTSGKNIGEVTVLHSPSPPIRVKRGDGSTGTVVFQDMVVCTPYSQDGDSGAVVLNDSGRVVGLHVLGSEGSSYFCRIGYVLEAFDIEVVGSPT